MEFTVFAGITQFSGPKSEIKEMCKALRLPNKQGYWQARAFLQRHAFFSGNKEKIDALQARFAWHRFYDLRKKTFLTGLLFRVTTWLDKCEIPYKITDKRKKLDKLPAIKKLGVDGEQRPEQIEAVNAALKYHRGILHLATNAGKTLVAAAIIYELEKNAETIRRKRYRV